jgi:hypothetical protein
MLTIRFDNQRRVVGWYGEIGLDAAETTLDWIAANKNRGVKRAKTEQNKSAADKFKQSMRF